MSAVNVTMTVSRLCRYQQGGGHWSFALQYILGLKDLGHEVCILNLFGSSGDEAADERLVLACLDALEPYGLRNDACLGVYPSNEEPRSDNLKLHCARYRTFEELASDTDILLNFACILKAPLLQLFRHRILLDTDPGHLQICAADWDLGIHDHHRWLTVGLNMGSPDCEVPALGVKWEPYFPVVYLPMWNTDTAPYDPAAPISSITHWTWGELLHNGRHIGAGKREAYLRYLDLPKRIDTSCELAVKLPDEELPVERQQLESAGWKITDPWQHLANPHAYHSFIHRSRAEICCAKEVFRTLNTGWLSDRSAAYLAAGKPVIADETGFGNHVEAGRGLFCVRSVDDAVCAVSEIDGNYALHSNAAREFASAYCDSRRVLPQILGV